MKLKDQLETQSLMLMAATLVGHVGSYAYHFITGRMLSEIEYGLLIALFAIINMILLPMSALGLALTRAVSVDLEHHKGSGLKNLGIKWSIGMTGAALCLLFVAFGFSEPLQKSFGFNRLAPILLAACIPGINLLLTLTGSLLQGLQQFKGLALRGSLLFVMRALLVGLCLFFGWKAAGWALLAHFLGMVIALGFSFWVLKKQFPTIVYPTNIDARPILMQALRLFPILLAFSTLMTADVILAKYYFDPVTSGQFAQAATLGRMILWLPLPIAHVMFPKVVRKGAATESQRYTLFKALGYTLILVLVALIVGWIGAPYALQWVYGIASPSLDQITWFRLTALAMAFLGPVYLLMQYQIARGKLKQLLPLCVLAVAFPILAYFRHSNPIELSTQLVCLTMIAFLNTLLLLRKETLFEPKPPIHKR